MAIYIGTTLLRGGCEAGGGGGGGEVDPGMPTDDLAALWRASTLSLADGDPVAAWPPAVGTPGTLTGAGSARPTYLATGSPLGGPAVAYDGVNDVLSLDAPAGLFTGADPGTIVAMVSRCPPGTFGYKHIVQYGSPATNEARGIGYNADLWVTVDWGSNLAGEATSPRSVAGAVLGHAYNGTTRRLWLGGAPIATGAVALNTGTTRVVCGRNLTGGYGGEHGSYRLMCLAFYNAELTDAQWAQVMTHARIAYGIEP